MGTIPEILGLILSLAQLVNRLRRLLKRLASLCDENILDVLERAKIGSNIRWHVLYDQQGILGTNYRNDCMDTYYVRLALDVNTLGSVAEPLDNNRLNDGRLGSI